MTTKRLSREELDRSTPYFTTQEAAVNLNVSVSTFRLHVAPHVAKHMIGRKPLYLKEDLDQHMTTRVVDETARRRSSKRRGSAHAASRKDQRVKTLAEQLERRANGS